MAVDVNKKKRNATTLKPGDKIRQGKKLTDEEKLIKKQGKYKILADMHDVLFTDKYNLARLAKDTKQPAILRGLAQMGIRIAAEGPIKEIEMVMNVYGISTKNVTTETNLGGTYPDFLNELASKVTEEK